MGWRKDAKEMIRTYPSLIEKETELKSSKITPSYSGMSGSSSASRTVEDLALRELSPEEQRVLTAVRQAIATTLRYRNGTLRMRLIDLVYWKATHTLQGAAMCCYVSRDTAYEWHQAFIDLVDAYYRVI